jgi:hypothetical protein
MNAFAAFLSESFWQGLVSNGIANVFAVGPGIPAGLYLQRLISSHGVKQQRHQLRAALKQAIEHNLGTLQIVKELLAKEHVPTFGLDLALFDATAHTKYETLNDIPLCASIDHLRFEMAHMDRQLDALFRLELDVMARNAPLYDRLYPQLVQAVKDRLPPLERECQEILSKVSF